MSGEEMRHRISQMLERTFNRTLKMEQEVFLGTPFAELTIGEIHTIEAIGDKRSRSMSEVAGDLFITLATLTTTVNRLTKKGYVERCRTDADRRIVLLQLTRKGRTVLRLHALYHHNMMDAVLADMSEADQSVLLDAFTRLHAFLQMGHHNDGMGKEIKNIGQYRIDSNR